MSVAVPTPVNAKRALRLVEFNLHLARYAHRSWYRNSLPEGVPDNLIFDTQGRLAVRVEPLVSSWLLQELRLDALMDWTMEEPQKRVWLLDRSSLERLARELALAMHREWVVRIIDSRRLRDLYTMIDKQAWRFVVEQVPGASFQYQVPVVSFEADPARDLGAELQDHGMRTLLALLEPGWGAVRERARLFFDRNKDLADMPVLAGAHVQRALELICDHLIPRRFPQWAWCF